jgi:riboflavin biosynthesis pyrimidine reductase
VTQRIVRIEKRHTESDRYPHEIGPALPAPQMDRMTMLLGPRQGPIGAEHFGEAYPWPASGRWVRGLMVATLDGASTGSDGRSGSISSSVDRAVMAQVRRHCDAIVIGASTFRAERYRPQRPAPDVQAERAQRGLRPAPTIVLVSRSLDLPWGEDAFRESTVPPLVVTAEACPAAALEAARQHADVVVLPGARVAVTDLMELLEERELDRIVCEGGPHLLSGIARAGFLDELDLALAPVMVGGGQIVLGDPAPNPDRYRLVQVIAADGFLFTRYVRADVAHHPDDGSTSNLGGGPRPRAAAQPEGIA